VKDQALEATIAAAAQKVAIGGGMGAVYGGLSANEIAAFVGAAVAVVGLVVQFYFKRKDDRRKAELHRLRMAGARFHDDEDDT